MTTNDSLTLRAARAQYFQENGFGTDGGYGDAWVDFSLGPIPMPFPNTPARIRAVRYHDLHHVLTGYRTTTIGEFEISAWELAAGCRGFAAAWVLNLGGMAAGTFVAPARMARAFLRGRQDRTLYGETFEPLLDETVDAVRARTMGVRRGPRAVDLALYAALTIAGVAVGLVTFALVLLALPLGFVNQARRRREAAVAAR